MSMFRVKTSLCLIALLLAATFASVMPVYADTVTPQDTEYADIGVYAGQSRSAYSAGTALGGEHWGHFGSGMHTTQIVYSITVEVEPENINLTDALIGDPSVNNNATDLGSITKIGDWSTPNAPRQFIWNGTIEPGQYLVLRMSGLVTGNIGDNASLQWTILSSKLAGDVDNVDTDLGNQTSSFTIPIIGNGDLAVETRLVTTDEINVGDTVTYDLYVKNVGEYAIADNSLGVFFLMPEGSTFGSIVDLDLDDDLISLGCAPFPAEYLPPDFPYDGDMIQCGLQSVSGSISPDSVFPFAINITASQAFSDGTAEVIGVALTLSGTEPDSSIFVGMIEVGQDAFSLDLNNIMRLAYDPNALTVTINRCIGIGAVVNVNDACFTVTFNKRIYAPSFTVDDIVLEGGGNVYSFVQDSDTQWTVRVNDMTLGGTLTLLLGSESVIDYSAVQNGTQVLGINTVRYEVESSDQGSNSSNNSGGSANQTTANGTLARTGTTTSGYVSYAIALMLIGLVLTVGSKKKLSRLQ